MELPLMTVFYVAEDAYDCIFFQTAVYALKRNVQLYSLDKDVEKTEIIPVTPSIIFLDLNIDNSNGFKTIAAIKQSPVFGNLPLVIFSNADNMLLVDKCQALGANLYLEKPTSDVDLQDVLETLLAIDWETFESAPHDFFIRFDGIAAAC